MMNPMIAFMAPIPIAEKRMRVSTHLCESNRKSIFPLACADPGASYISAVTSKTSETNSKENSTKSFTLPPFHINRSPHLSDYVPNLPSLISPLRSFRKDGTFLAEEAVALSDIVVDDPSAINSQKHNLEAFLRAGPKEKVVFGPGVRAAIVSCGGLCPGINSVIGELTLCLYQYGASRVFGVQHGYRGFYNDHWRDLTAEDVEGAHKLGGSILGSSRGGFDLQKIVDAIETRDIDMVFVIGGDGTIMGCNKIFHEVKRRRLKTAVVSVPKTIDNDIAVIDRSFGMSLSSFFHSYYLCQVVITNS